MTFSTYSFTLIFLPAVVLLYYLVGKRSAIAAKLLLIVSSLFFCAYSSLHNLWVFAISIVFNYVLMLLIQRSANRKRIVTIGVVLNCLLLCFYKYGHGLILPLGISYYTFQNIAFLVEMINDEELRNVTVIDFLFYETFFPKLMQGPITPPQLFLSQCKNDKTINPDWEKMFKGLYLFSIGLVKKIFIADRFAEVADIGFEWTYMLNSISVLISVVAFAVQIYFDFSAYSDMAIGIGKLLGIDLPENFDSPYKAVSIRDFWKRWHISLTSFLTKYIYIPLGGNRKGRVRMYLNIMVVFIISGIWHGSGANYIVWGCIHGLAMVIYRIFEKPLAKLPKLIGWMLTMVFVVFSWIFFRAISLDNAIEVIRTILSFDMSGGISQTITVALQYAPISILLPQGLMQNIGWVVIDFVVTFIVLFLAPNSTKIVSGCKSNYKTILAIALLFLFGVLSMSGGRVFLYVMY